MTFQKNYEMSYTNYDEEIGEKREKKNKIKRSWRYIETPITTPLIS